MANRFHAAMAACAGALVLTAAGVAPGAGDDIQPTLLAAYQEPAPRVADLVVTPTPFPGQADPVTSASDQQLKAGRAEAQDTISDEERRCLAIAVYHESRGEPRAGQMAVAQVIVNRAMSGRYPKSFCGVIRQPSQFPGLASASYTPRPGADWRVAQDVADDVLDGERAAQAHDAMYFHATRVQPAWRGRVKLATIGNHVFYR